MSEKITTHDKRSKMIMKVKVKVAQSCPTVCDPRNYTVRGILQARILEWVAFPFSKGSSQPRDWTQISDVAGRFFTSWATKEAQKYWSGLPCPPPEDLPDPGIKPKSPALAGRFFTIEPPGKPLVEVDNNQIETLIENNQCYTSWEMNQNIQITHWKSFVQVNGFDV